MAIHDLQCQSCEFIESNAIVDTTKRKGGLPKCIRCSGKNEILWTGKKHFASVHPKERAVVWMNRQTGSVATPPVNNVDMPARYKNNGYERVEFRSLRELDQYCKERKLVNEVASFDGSGHQDEL